MSKDRSNNSHYETSRLAIDFYHPMNNGDFVCSCYTPGASATIEPEYLVKTVTYKELKEAIADGAGKVNVSFFQDECAYISFDKYLSGLNCYQIEMHCIEVINKREFRDHLFDPAIYQKHLTPAA